MDGPLTAAILVVSTTASKDPSTDAATEVLHNVLKEQGEGKWKLVTTNIVSDDQDEIELAVEAITNVADPANLLITTGGTGFAVSDQTPEVVEKLLQKKAPGLVHAMLASSLAVTPFAMMSRPVAGVRRKTIIVTLPGSPKGARENLQAIIKTLPHACLQAAGADSRSMHSGGTKKLEKEAGLTEDTDKSASDDDDVKKGDESPAAEDKNLEANGTADKKAESAAADHDQEANTADEVDGSSSNDEFYSHVDNTEDEELKDDDTSEAADESRSIKDEDKDEIKDGIKDEPKEDDSASDNDETPHGRSQDQESDHGASAEGEADESSTTKDEPDAETVKEASRSPSPEQERQAKDADSDDEKPADDKADEDDAKEKPKDDLNDDSKEEEATEETNGEGEGKADKEGSASPASEKEEGSAADQDEAKSPAVEQEDHDKNIPGLQRIHSHEYGAHNHKPLVRHPPPEGIKSNDPKLGPTRRHRESPYPMISVDEALSIISEYSTEPEVLKLKVDEHIIGPVLAENIQSEENVPAFRASIVDGYAVVVPEDGNLKGVFPVVSVSHAAPGDEIQPLKEGEIARITTGAPLPPGATSVIMVEDTILRTLTDDGKEEKEVEIQAEGVKEGENIREIGSDVQKGDTILYKGEQISGVGGEIGLLAASGIKKVQVYGRPVVGILSTGDELVEHNSREELRHGQVRDTNRPTLLSAALEWGYQVRDLGIAKDKSETLEEILREGLRRSDVLITTGGVSMGELDLLKPTIERSLGGTIHFGRVAMKPGKPTTFATVPVKDNSGKRVTKLIFSLPGNPASALVTFHLFVLPSLHKQSGISPVGLPKVAVVLAHDFPMDPRPEYHRAVVTVGKDGVLYATSTGGQRSSKIGSMKSANAMVVMPSGKGMLDKGTKVNCLIITTLGPE